jgi:hypothetical protein
MAMIQGLAVGVGAFAHSATTGGREGGVQEVQQYQAKQQQMAVQAKEEARTESEQPLRMQVLQAQSHIAQVQAMGALPNLNADLHGKYVVQQNQTTEAYKNELETADKAGFDITVPWQKAAFEKLSSIGSASSQPGAINLPWDASHTPKDIGAGYAAAANDNGKNINDYATLLHFNDDKSANGGALTGVPVDSPLAQSTASPRQEATRLSAAQLFIDHVEQVSAAHPDWKLTDNPTYKSVKASFDTQTALVGKGTMPSWLDSYHMRWLTEGPAAGFAKDVDQRVETEKSLATAKEQELKTEQAAQMHQSYLASHSPLPEAEYNAGQMALQDAIAKQNTPQGRAELEKTRQETVNAKLQNTDQQTKMLFDNGVNPTTGERLNLGNAPDEMLVDTSTGNPIPNKMAVIMKPSMQERNRGDFAMSVLHSFDAIDKLRAQGKLPNGPVTGRLTELLSKAGVADYTDQEALNFTSLMQSAATGAHVGGRFNIPIMEKMGHMATLSMNDDQFLGGENALRSVMGQYVLQGGRETVASYKGSLLGSTKTIQGKQMTIVGFDKNGVPQIAPAQGQQ